MENIETHEEHESKPSAGDEMPSINYGKSKCCKAEVEYSGGGYDGEEIVPVISFCKSCGASNPKVIQKVGRPIKIPF